MIVKVEKLSKSFFQGDQEIRAVQDVSFDLNKGETLSIVGPSGSGKTTLLSLLAGLDDPTGGNVSIRDHQLTKMTERELSQFRANYMGIVFQQFHLMPYMTAFENICLPLEITQEKNIEQRAIAALESVGLSSRKDHRPDQLSGGERQRVAIARALVIDPEILLADEPSGNLDTQTGESIMKLLFDLVDKNKMTLILVTHNPDHANLCQRTLKMKGGRAE